MNWYLVEQLPVAPLGKYATTRFGGRTAGEIVDEAVLELTYTAYDQAGNSYLGNVSHAGARPWLVLLPATLANPTGAQTLTLTTRNASDIGFVSSLVWQPGYL